MNTDPIVVKQQFEASVSVVWKAITNHQQMRQWYFPQIPAFKAVVGFETEFDVECEGNVYPHLWKVTEVVAERRIAYSWRFGGYDGASIADWELTETPDGTCLTLTHSGQHTFDQSNPVFSRESGEAGWGYLINQSLKHFIGQKRENHES